MHLKALRLIALEQQLADETRRGLPLLMPLPLDFEPATRALEWSPRSRDCSLALEAGHRHLLLIRSLEKTVVNFRLAPPLTAGTTMHSAAVRFKMNDLPAKAWVIAEYGPDFSPPVVFISLAGESLDQRLHLLPDERQRLVPFQKDEGEARCLARFLAARKILETYENETIAKAGGPSGTAAFRMQLLSETELLRRSTRPP